MFEALYRMLTGIDGADDAIAQNDPAFALAVLLIEVARSDDRVDAREETVTARVLARRFDLGREQVAQLIAAAKEGASRSSDLHRFTKIVVDNFSEAERTGVIEMLWEVAYSDGALSGDEDALIRRVAGLIYVSDRDRGEARHRARERLDSLAQGSGG